MDFFFYKVDNTNPITYQCINACGEEHLGYIYKLANDGKECFKSCTNEYPYLSPGENICYDDCLKSRQNPFTLPYLNICNQTCDENTDYKYWGQNKKCIDNCTQLGDTQIINYNNECVEKCDFTSTYKFELDGKKYSVNPGVAHFLEHLLGEKSKYGDIYSRFTNLKLKFF